MMKLTSGKIINLGVAAFFGLVILMGYKTAKRIHNDQVTWQQTACPSLLSIGRSSRDTLIIMKNLPDCNRFVLDNLK